MVKFSIQISTKNRIADLTLTLDKISVLLVQSELECVVFDDGSSDGTYEFVTNNYPEIILHRNIDSKGYLFCRNKMLNETRAAYTISLDDDAHFLSDDPLQKIESHFNSHPKCGLIAFRIFWGLEPPDSQASHEITERVKGFVGCGHAWRMDSWRQIPNYPEWFEFYGEETFASLCLFKDDIEVHYLPSVLIHHRVDLKKRRMAPGFSARYRNSLKADYFLYFLFYPMHVVPGKIAYSVWKQLTTKILRGSPALFFPLSGAVLKIFGNTPNLIKHRMGFTPQQYKGFQELKDTKIYWKP